MSEFEGQETMKVLIKAVLAAVIYPAIEEIEDVSQKEGGATIQDTDEVMDRIVLRMEMLGFHMDPHFSEREIVNNLSYVIDMFSEDAKADPSQPIN